MSETNLTEEEIYEDTSSDEEMLKPEEEIDFLDGFDED